MNAESPDRNLAIDGELQESVERDLDFKLGLLTNSIKPRVSQLPFILIPRHFNSKTLCMRGTLASHSKLSTDTTNFSRRRSAMRRIRPEAPTDLQRCRVPYYKFSDFFRTQMASRCRFNVPPRRNPSFFRAAPVLTRSREVFFQR